MIVHLSMWEPQAEKQAHVLPEDAMFLCHGHMEVTMRMHIACTFMSATSDRSIGT